MKTTLTLLLALISMVTFSQQPANCPARPANCPKAQYCPKAQDCPNVQNCPKAQNCPNVQNCPAAQRCPAGKGHCPMRPGRGYRHTSPETCALRRNVSLQLYSLRDDIKRDYASTVKIAGTMGYTSIEAAGYDNGLFYGRTPAEFKSDLEAAGLYMLSSHTGRGLSPKELKAGKASSETWAWWDTCIAAHKAAGASYIVTPWLDVPKTLADLQTYCEYYNEIGRRCQAAGLKYGYHNHAHEFQMVEGEVMYDYMLQHTDPSLVLFEMDVYWVVRGQCSPVEYFAKYPGRFELLHLKDHKELGRSGMVGFDAIFRNTGIAGTRHFVVEVEQYDHTPAESVKMSLDYLQACPMAR